MPIQLSRENQRHIIKDMVNQIKAITAEASLTSFDEQLLHDSELINFSKILYCTLYSKIPVPSDSTISAAIS